MTWKVRDDAITCTIEPVGRDWLITLTGGEKDSDRHIGAVSIAHTTGVEGVGTASTLVFPDHKEYILTEPMALEAWSCLQEHGGNVTVVCGIHFDFLNSDQIQYVVQVAWETFRIELQRIIQH